MNPNVEQVLIDMLSAYMDKQNNISLQLNTEITVLSGKIETMDRNLTSEIHKNSVYQTKVLGGLLALVIIIMAAMAGVTVSGQVSPEGANIDAQARQTE